MKLQEAMMEKLQNSRYNMEILSGYFAWIRFFGKLRPLSVYPDVCFRIIFPKDWIQIQTLFSLKA